MKLREKLHPLTVFLVFQGLLITAGLSWAAWRVTHQRRERALPALRQEPLWVRPRYDNPLVVTDDQLRQTLRKLAPRFRETRSPVSTLDHALRFWGFPATFADVPQALSGKEMHRLMVDHEQFAEYYGKDAKPLLDDLGAGKGVRYRTVEGDLSSSHVDHTLACLLEVGTPLDYSVRTPTRTTTVKTLVEQSLRDFSLNQDEYEWNAIVYALCLQPPGRWMTEEGQWMDFDRIAERIMRERLPRGVCRGQHRLHALVVLLRVDETERILSDAGRQRIVDFLREITARLVGSQLPDGSWDGNWETAHKPKEGAEPAITDVSDRLLVTGHALEWWSLAPEELLPPRETLIQAGQWAVKAILELDDATIIKRYGPLSHAGRALALWRGLWPYQVELDPSKPLSRKKPVPKVDSQNSLAIP
jgi:hypothetical protein